MQSSGEEKYFREIKKLLSSPLLLQNRKKSFVCFRFLNSIYYFQFPGCYWVLQFTLKSTGHLIPYFFFILMFFNRAEHTKKKKKMLRFEALHYSNKWEHRFIDKWNRINCKRWSCYQEKESSLHPIPGIWSFRKFSGSIFRESLSFNSVKNSPFGRYMRMQ